jgi:hypothetical protein
MIVHAVVFGDNQKELVGDQSLFTDQREAMEVCDQWNANGSAFATRSATVVPLTVQ